MLPSSTSSSESPPGGTRHWRRFFVIVLLLLAGVETALRFPQVRTLLPPRTHYYHPAITTRLDAVERMVSEQKRVDVLFIGSSIVLTNMHPETFDGVVGQPLEGVSFNVGLPGLWPTSVHLYAEHLWLPTARPRLVVQGVRYPELAVSTHAKNESQVWSGRIEPSWRDSDLLTRLHATLVSNVYLLQYRGAGVRILERFRNGWISPDDPESDRPYETRGYQAMAGSADRPVEQWEADLPNDGVCDGRRCEVGFEALRRTIAAVRASGSAYVLVNVPEHPSRWQGPGGLERYRHYVERLRQFAEAEGVGFIDPTGGDPFRFADTPYADLAHMTPAGSQQFTRELARQMSPLVADALRGTPVAAGRREDQRLGVVGLSGGQGSSP